MLDRLRVAFPYVVAVALPLAGVVLAVLRYTQGEREDALQHTAIGPIRAPRPIGNDLLWECPRI
jgi:hypothetical protein